MPHVLAVCQSCGSRVPLPLNAPDGARLTLKSHTVTFPCANCGGLLRLKDGTYTASSYKFTYSPTVSPSQADCFTTMKQHFMYGDYVRRISQEFDGELQKIEAHHNFELGDEFEKVICKVLRRLLPSHFGVCRGYVVDEHGNEEGDDVIIFDRMRFPRLRPVDESDFDTTQRIPIEAVYAYIEAKHTLVLSGTGGQSFAKAIEQVGDVKALCATREPVSRRALNRYATLGEGFKQEIDSDWPEVRNPMFTAIFARFVRLREGHSRIDSSAVIHELEANQQDIPSPFDNSPDLVVLGSDVSLLPIVSREDPETQEYVSPFLVSGAKLVPFSCQETSFAIALCDILYALDNIELGRLEWSEIIGEVVTMGNPAS